MPTKTQLKIKIRTDIQKMVPVQTDSDGYKNVGISLKMSLYVNEGLYSCLFKVSRKCQRFEFVLSICQQVTLVTFNSFNNC